MWEFLNEGDTIKGGDEYYCTATESWECVPIGIIPSDIFTKNNWGTVRRKISDAVESPDSGKERQPSGETNTAQLAIALMQRIFKIAEVNGCPKCERFDDFNEIVDEWHSATTSGA